MIDDNVPEFSEKMAAYLFCHILLATPKKEDRERLCEYWNDDHKSRRK